MNTEFISIQLPLGFGTWMPWVQAATLGLLTFVQEDVPTVSSALLAASGNLSWTVAFIGCFFGIWMGDALLYLLARGVGRPLLEHSWARRFFDPAAVARSERWFAQRGAWLLVTSRLVPGTRLPTYLAAGFLRLPFGKFLLITGGAVAVWTITIFALARWLGEQLMGWLHTFGAGGVALVIAIVLAVLLLRITMKLAQPGTRRRISASWGRSQRWEFWPAWVFYTPVAVNYLRLAIKYRGFTLPTAANPGIFSGGFVGESKIITLQQLSDTSADFTAQAFLLPEGDERREAQLLALLEERRIYYPFILKPDVGQRGLGVKLIRNAGQIGDYLRQTTLPLIAQRYAPGPHEAGVFYFRFPHEPRGRIFAITEKIFPVITGDGQRTIEDLVWDDPRARFVAEKYLSRLAERRFDIPATGESIKLVEAGNHAQGCIFQDGAHLWSSELELRIDEISRGIEGFYIGRYDIRFSAAEELRAGRNFQIIELNGAASEATNIYDARNSLRTAYRTLFRQWELVFAIGAANRNQGTTPTPLATLWHAWRAGVAASARYPLAD